MEPLVRTEIPSPDREEVDSLFEVSNNFDGYAYFGGKKYVLQQSVYTAAEQWLRSLQLRKDDVWIGGFSRSGTHWLAELTWLLYNNLDFAKAEEIEHEERIIYYDFNPRALQSKFGEDGKIHIRENGPELFFGPRPSPRFFKTHFALSLLPSKLLDTTKMVYVARDPRDVAVSCYYYYKSFKDFRYLGDFKTFWKIFQNDLIVYGPYFENVKEWWNARNHPNLLFLFYEELLADLPDTARRVSEFLGLHYSDEDIKRLCEYLNFNNMKKNKAVNHDPRLGKESEQVVRKGVSGGWRQEFDEEMTRSAENWIAKNLKDTDLRFPSMK